MGGEKNLSCSWRIKGMTHGETSGKYHLLLPFSRSEYGLDATSLNVEKDTGSTNKQSQNQNKHRHMETLFSLRKTY
jgi:hypothetical protein